MKLYFPTTSLNFNDIFATESLSPKKYYSLRKYGTRRHFSTELSFDDSYVFLFKKIPYFDLLKQSNSTLDEYPMILEIDVNFENNKILKISEEIYAINETIYFNIFNLNVLFLSNEHINKVLKKSSLIIETKNVYKYRNCFKVLEFNNFTKINRPVSLNLPTYNIHNKLKNDQLFNSIKGLFYGFYYKRYSSPNENTILLKEIAYGLNDILMRSEKLTEEAEVINDILLLAKKQIKKQYSNSRKVKSNIDVKKIFEYKVDEGIYFLENIFRGNLEKELFEKIINYFIYNSKQKVGHLETTEINTIVNDVKRLIELDKKIINNYYKDINLIYDRFIKNDYEVDIKHINSIVLQNLYTFLLKYNNVDELKKYISIKALDSEYILYSFMGSFIGYSGLDREVTENLFRSDDFDLIKDIDCYLNEIRVSIVNSNFKESNVDIVDNNVEQIRLFEEPNVEIESSNNKNYMGEIFKDLQDIKQNKNISQLLKLGKINLNDRTEVIFEKENNNVIISIISDANIFETILVYKGNVKEKDLTNFKRELKLYGINSVFTRGNYPMIEIFEIKDDEKHIVSQDNQKWIFNILNSIKTYFR